MTQQNLSLRAASARESARAAGGQFGTQPQAEACLELGGGTEPQAPRSVAVPARSDDEAMTRFVGEEVGRHRLALHGEDPTVHYDGDAIVSDLKRELAGVQLSEEQLGELFERHQYLDPRDYEYKHPGLWGRLIGRPRQVQPRSDVQASWP